MSHFDISKLEIELKDLEAETLKEDFWQDAKHSNKVLAKINQIQSGNFGDHKSLGDQVSELRLMYGPGYITQFAIE